MLYDRIHQNFLESAQLKQRAADYLTPSIVQAVNAIVEALAKDKKILICGNGGSAADAQHFSAEFVGRYEKERRELAAIALTTDTSILTAVANDYSYDEIFARQVRALGQTDDILIAITTSGNSTNVLRSVEAAHAKGMRTIALTGRDGGAMNGVLTSDDIHLCVPHHRTARIQEIHLLILHAICDAVDALLLGELKGA